MTAFPVRWVAPDPGPPYVLAVALAPDDEPCTPLRPLLTEHLQVIGWCDLPNQGVAAAIAGIEPRPDTTMELGQRAHEAAVLVLTDGPLADLRLPGDAERVVELGETIRRIYPGRDGFTSAAELAAISALRTVPLRDRIAFIRRALGPVLSLPPRFAGPLVETLAAMSSGVGVKDVAADLCVHKKTVVHRRRRIALATGLRAWVPADRFHLMLAFFFWRMDGENLPEIGSKYWQT